MRACSCSEHVKGCALRVLLLLLVVIHIAAEVEGTLLLGSSHLSSHPHHVRLHATSSAVGWHGGAELLASTHLLLLLLLAHLAVVHILLLLLHHLHLHHVLLLGVGGDTCLEHRIRLELRFVLIFLLLILLVGPTSKRICIRTIREWIIWCSCTTANSWGRSPTHRSLRGSLHVHAAATAAEIEGVIVAQLGVLGGCLSKCTCICSLGEEIEGVLWLLLLLIRR